MGAEPKYFHSNQNFSPKPTRPSQPASIPHPPNAAAAHYRPLPQPRRPSLHGRGSTPAAQAADRSALTPRAGNPIHGDPRRRRRWWLPRQRRWVRPSITSRSRSTTMASSTMPASRSAPGEAQLVKFRPPSLPLPQARQGCDLISSSRTQARQGRQQARVGHPQLHVKAEANAIKHHQLNSYS